VPTARDQTETSDPALKCWATILFLGHLILKNRMRQAFIIAGLVSLIGHCIYGEGL